MFNNYPYGTQIYPQQQYGLKGRPVSSVEEVRAAQIDFDGSLFIFPDIANKRIYTKQINLDGTAALRAYALIEEKEATPAYVTKEELDSIVRELKESLSKEQKKNDGPKSTQTGSNNEVFAF